MALNFNLMNTDLPGQISGSFQQGYQGAQDRTNVLEKREQEKRTQLAQVIQNGARSIVASPNAYKSVFARVKKVAGVPLDDDERRYDEAFATGGEEAVKRLAMADADFDIQTVLSLRDREAFDAYLKGQQPAAQPTNALTASRAAPSALGSGTFDPTAPAAPASTPMALDLPRAGSDAQRTTNALDPSIIERMGGLSQPSVLRTTNALDPSIIERMGLSQPSAQQPVNAMAPAPVAPTNALAPTAQVDPRAAIQNEIMELSRFNDPRAAARVKRLEQQLTAMEPRVVGGSMYYPNPFGTGEFKTPSKERTSSLLTPEEEAQQIRIAQQKRPPATGRAPSAGGGGVSNKINKVVTDESGRTRFFNSTAQEIIPTSSSGQSTVVQGKPSAIFEKTRAQKQQLTKDMDLTINELSEISKKGGLIDQSTGSGAGRLVDVGARFVGQDLPGDIAIGKLQPIADMVLKMVPRFEGPQSDKDTTSYKEAAGQLANASLPREIRKAAAIEVLRIMKARKNQFVTEAMANQGVSLYNEASDAPNIDALLEKYK